MPGTPLLTFRRVEDERPSCAQCGAPMLIARIEPLQPAYQSRTWECPKCGHECATVVQRS
jgi:predicted RNA-binding Zn-ribbon protein involved in translation (DUF1610 family)